MLWYLDIKPPDIYSIFLIDAIRTQGYGIGNDVPHDNELFICDDGNSGIGINWDKYVLDSIPIKKQVITGCNTGVYFSHPFNNRSLKNINHSKRQKLTKNFLLL